MGKEAWNGNGCQDTDDGNNDHQLNQCKTPLLLLYHSLQHLQVPPFQKIDLVYASIDSQLRKTLAGGLPFQNMYPNSSTINGPKIARGAGAFLRVFSWFQASKNKRTATVREAVELIQ